MSFRVMRRKARTGMVKLDLDAVRRFPGVLACLTRSDVPGTNDCSPVHRRRSDPCRWRDHVSRAGGLCGRRRNARYRAPRGAIGQNRDRGWKAGSHGRRRIVMGTNDVLPPYEFKRGNVRSALAKSRAIAIRGKLPRRRAGAFLSRRPGQSCAPRRAWRHDRLFFDAASNRSAALHCENAGVADAKVVCECRRMGGAFGGKESQAAQWAALAALAARITGRPAKCRLDRDEDMIMTGKRHDFRINYSAGFDKTGRLDCRRCRVPGALRLFGGSVEGRQ